MKALPRSRILTWQTLLTVLASLGLALTLACGAISSPPTAALTSPPPTATSAPLTSTLEPTAKTAPSATPTLAVTPTAQPTILFSDDFSDPNSGWKQQAGGLGLADYTDGAYRIRVDQGNASVLANPEQEFDNVRVEVDASQQGGLDQVFYGIVCRYQDERNFYGFIITGDRGSGIFKLKAGEFSNIGGENFRYDSAINPHEENNHIRAECVGDELVLYSNDQILIYERDADFASGDVGLIVGTANSPEAEVVFDDFVVYQTNEVTLSTAEESRLEARRTVDEGWRLVQAGQVTAAIEAYELAQALDPTLELGPADWNTLCWYGSIWEKATEVMFACERAVAAAPDDASIRDSRGVARALTGDYTGAIEDFQAFVEWSRQVGAYEALGRQREAWILDLEAGQNPFDAETLEALRNDT